MKKRIITLVILLTLCSLTSYADRKNNSDFKNSRTNILLDTTKPYISHEPVYSCRKNSWPISIFAYVTDSSGIDSVWVKWYKNDTGTMNRQFKMNHYIGGNYGGTFNSVNSEVNIWDIIYYRIIAQDASSTHNRDSTQLIPITIIDGPYCQIGNGTDTTIFPFTTYWMDGRTQMLFTAQELNSCGFSWGGILSIGFRVFSFSPQILNGFNIRFQHTNLTSLTGFVSPGWTTAYTGTYSIQDTGWQTINLPYISFWYNGTSNLLVDICYHNTSYTQYSFVYATQVSGKTCGYYMDYYSGCQMGFGSAQAKRPNIRFTFQSWVNVKNKKGFIPDKFAISQNYPNPFNPFTRIDFDIPKKGFVSLKVYDVLGREVQTLINEEKSAGSYSVDFNGSELTSGVYFYRLTTDGFSETKKMILMK